MQFTKFTLTSAISFAALLTACGGGGGGTAVVYGCMDNTATNYNSSATSQTGITCTYTPTCTLTANPAAVQVGNSSTLHWATANATTFSINQSIGSLTPVALGSKGITPSVTTTYTGTATGAGGTATCTATVTVSAVPIYGCMDSTATNYNPSATSSTGITCTYPVIIYGCMDPIATNYNKSATSSTGITCTY